MGMSKLIRNYFGGIKVIAILLFVSGSLFQANTYAQSCSTTEEIAEYLPAKVSGGVDFTIIGGTQNPNENNASAGANQPGCSGFLPILSTTATLSIPAGDTLKSAHLYWSGTGSDFENITLNDEDITADRCWETTLAVNGSVGLFAGYADVSDLVLATGEGDYTFSGMDNTSVYRDLNCTSGGSVLYGGWALVVVYQNRTVYDDYTLFFYDGFRNFQYSTFDINIQTNVFDKFQGSHVGVVAWEGDKDPFEGDVDRITLNDQLLPSTGYTNPRNVFNGTNSFEVPVNNSFYNADIDDFDASDVVQQELNTPGANFNFSLDSGQDLILLNTLVLRIPNEAPDALVTIPETPFPCDSRTVTFDYTYLNDDEATGTLEQNTPVVFYLNNSETGAQIGVDLTDVDLRPGQSDTNTATVTIPDGILGDFEIVAVIDDPRFAAAENGTVLEIDEDNNTFTVSAFIDQSCFIDGTEFTVSGTYPFNFPTVRGGCDSTGVVVLNVNPVFRDLVENRSICEGDTFVLPDGNEVSPDPSGMPYEFVTNPKTINGCDSIITTFLTVNPHARFEIDAEICVGDEYILPDGVPAFDTDTYVITLEGVAQNGCDSITTVNLKVNDIFYPTAFTPNGDGENDGFRALFPRECPNNITNYDLRIFDRWGQEVFQANDFSRAWNGIFEAEKGVPGLYLWVVRYDLPFRSGVKRQGGVTLLQ